MAQFHGMIGYGITEEDPPDSGVFVDKIVTHPYYGEILRNSRNLEPGEGVNDDITVTNRISIVADEYAIEHFFFIKYVEWAGVRWTVSNVTVDAPRLILSLGSVYNGPA